MAYHAGSFRSCVSWLKLSPPLRRRGSRIIIFDWKRFSEPFQLTSVQHGKKSKLECYFWAHQSKGSFSSIHTTSAGAAVDDSVSTEAGDGYRRKELLSVCIMGPPNAGKSTLFNRLIDKSEMYTLASEKRKVNKKKKDSKKKKNAAIVSSTPGTTRDRREGLGRIGDVTFQLVDTAGIDKESLASSHLKEIKNKNDIQEELSRNMVQQSLWAAQHCDVILLVLDARYSNILYDLQDLLPHLRRKQKNSHNQNGQILVLANKLEGDVWATNEHIVEQLNQVERIFHNNGDSNVIIFSAEHGDGMADLAAKLSQFHNHKNKHFQPPPLSTDESLLPDTNKNKSNKPIPVAILGRPNVGKSTMINALLGTKRVIASSMPGTTRDAISIPWSWKGHDINLIDTAGLTQFHSTPQSIEDAAIHNALRAMYLAHVVVLVIDVSETMWRRFELTLAQAILQQGRVVVIAANKMDTLIKDHYTKQQLANDIQTQLELRFPALRLTPVIPMTSIDTQEGLDQLMPAVLDARHRWSQIVSTSVLNRWLSHVLQVQPPPSPTIQIKYIIQTKGRPPTFLLFGNVSELPTAYVRYLKHSLQYEFGLYGMEIRMVMKKTSGNNEKIKMKKLSTGIGGWQGRQKRTIAALKKTGKVPHKRRKRRNTKNQYR